MVNLQIIFLMNTMYSHQGGHRVESQSTVSKQRCSVLRLDGPSAEIHLAEDPLVT